MTFFMLISLHAESIDECKIHYCDSMSSALCVSGGAASADPRYPLAVKCLSLLNLLLLTAAIVIGIYCKHER